MFRLKRILIAFLICCALAGAQVPTSTVNGIVTDVQGAVVVDAKVTLTRPETAQVRETMTNSEGAFVFANLPPAQYALKVEKQGFAIAEVKAIEVQVGRVATLDVP